eukprot:scaffold2301_cov79-Isochrysis_galbana.AAC.2
MVINGFVFSVLATNFWDSSGTSRRHDAGRAEDVAVRMPSVSPVDARANNAALRAQPVRPLPGRLHAARGSVPRLPR